MAKGLGGGVPIGAILATDEAAQALGPGTHASTFGGNPLACAAALAVVNTIEDEHLVEHAEAMGERLRNALADGLAGLNSVVEIRGSGLMIGIVMAHPCGELVTRAMDRGLLINVTADNVVRLLPPLIIDEAEVDELATGLCALIREWSAGEGA